MNKSINLSDALLIAINVHGKQVDKQNNPYILHITRVVEKAYSEEEKIIAALHDVWEDSPGTTLPFVYPSIYNSLVLLTRNPEITYKEYINKIYESKNLNAIKIKILDLEDNLSNMPIRPRVTAQCRIKRFEQELQSAYWDKQWLGLQDRYTKALTILKGE
jgi:(p)ppGpp synthase/HD superfamily hydrolase